MVTQHAEASGKVLLAFPAPILKYVWPDSEAVNKALLRIVLAREDGALDGAQQRWRLAIEPRSIELAGAGDDVDVPELDSSWRAALRGHEGALDYCVQYPHPRTQPLKSLSCHPGRSEAKSRDPSIRQLVRPDMDTG